MVQGLSGDFLDVVETLNSSRKLSASNDSYFTFPSSSPTKRIDFVLYRGDIEPTEVSQFGQFPDGDAEKLSNYPSDHLGLLASFVKKAHDPTSLNP